MGDPSWTHLMALRWLGEQLGLGADADTGHLHDDRGDNITCDDQPAPVPAAPDDPIDPQDSSHAPEPAWPQCSLQASETAAPPESPPEVVQDEFALDCSPSLLVELASMTTATLRQNRLAELAAEKRAELKAAETGRKHGRPTKQLSDRTKLLKHELSRLEGTAFTPGLLPGEPDPPPPLSVSQLLGGNTHNSIVIEYHTVHECSPTRVWTGMTTTCASY